MVAQGYAVEQMSITIDYDLAAGANPPVEANVAIMGVTWHDGMDAVDWQTAAPSGRGAGVVRGPQFLVVKYAVQFGTGTMATLLDTNAGKRATVVFKPDPTGASTHSLTGDVLLVRGEQDFQIGAVATATATWQCLDAGLVIVP